jgi:glycosyltransferase involved in cell wall biosynthesis
MIHKAIPKFEFYYAGRNTPPAFRALDTAGVFSVGEVASAAGFIADKRICIVPMWSGGGMRIKVVEAMAAGKVVISTEAGMRGVDARPGEHYLMIYKPEDFVRAINWCLDNQDAANEMAERARQMVLENYDHTPVMAKVTRELEQLLKVRTNWR